MLRLFISLICTASAAYAQTPLTLDALCQQEPERIEALFEALNLDRPALATVKAHVQAENWPAACNALLEYYRAKFADQAIVPANKENAHAAADAMLDDTFTVQGVTDRVPRLAAGGLDWNHRGPEGDREWAWLLNRHSHIPTLLNAYADTGDAKYAQAIDAQLQDWVLSNPYPGEKSSTGPWRGLEAAKRPAPWARVFAGLINNDALSPATAILMLSSLPDHADYLKRFHAPHGNWITMEMNGLLHIAEIWPEFKDAESWVAYSVEQMTPALLDQVYPDGAQMELTSHYHAVALSSFERFANQARKNGVEFPAVWPETLEKMWHYLAYTMRPDGYGALNNDSDRDHNRDRVLAAADRFSREDWRYIATNGAEGTEPAQTALVTFPWAGHAIFRSDWDADAAWLFFDYGPYGTAHQHMDKLHLSLSAFGRDLLVDGGRYSYAGSPWRKYFKGTASHNTVLIDGRRQRPYTKQSTEAIKDPWSGSRAGEDGPSRVSHVRGVFDSGYDEIEGDATHTRIVSGSPELGYVVVDKITTDRPRKITALWHFHPDCAVEIEGEDAVTQNDRGNVRVQPFGDLNWNVSIVKGQEEPNIQGWYSVRYNDKAPAPCAVYTASIEGTTVFAWRIGIGETLPAAKDLVLTVNGMEAKVTARENASEYVRVQIGDPHEDLSSQ